MNKFRENFKVMLHQVLAYYPKARIEADHRGLILKKSPPPVSGRLILV